MSSSENKDPMDFLKSMWNSVGFSLPGMVTPTLDVDELGKRIADMKAVEGWLKMNLSTLQMTIQGLEVQRATLAALQAISQTATTATAEKANSREAGSDQNNANDAAETLASAFSALNLNPALNPALWPWNFTQTPAETPTKEASAAKNAAPPPVPQAHGLEKNRMTERKERNRGATSTRLIKDTFSTVLACCPSHPSPHKSASPRSP